MSRLFLVLFLLLFQKGILESAWTKPEILSDHFASNPFIASDHKGNVMAVWYEGMSEFSPWGSLRSAWFINNQWIYTENISDENVQIPFHPHAHSLGMDSEGNALAVWLDRMKNIRAARISVGETKWSLESSPLNALSKNVSFPTLSTSSNGYSAVIWTETIGFDECRVFANVYHPMKKQWMGEQEIFIGVLSSIPIINQIVINDQGDALAILSFHKEAILAARYHLQKNQWDSITLYRLDKMTGLAKLAATLDSLGNGFFVWSLNDQSITGALLLKNKNDPSQARRFSAKCDDQMSFPIVKVDQAGNALAIWSERGGLGSSRYSSIKKGWERIPVRSLNGKTPINISLSMDDLGNGLAVSVIPSYQGSYLQTAKLPKNKSKWELLTSITTETNFCQNPQVIITSNGNAHLISEKNTKELSPNAIQFSSFHNFSNGIAK